LIPQAASDIGNQRIVCKALCRTYYIHYVWNGLLLSLLCFKPRTKLLETQKLLLISLLLIPLVEN